MQVDLHRVHEGVIAIVHRHQCANAATALQPPPPLPTAGATLAQLGIGSLQALDVLFDIEDLFGFAFADNRAAELGGAPLHTLLQATVDALHGNAEIDASHA